MLNNDLLKNYKIEKTEKLCPFKYQGMNFLIYTDDTVKCVTCGKISKLSDLLSDY